MNETSPRDLARLGSELGEQDTELFTTTLYALSSPQSGDVGSERCIGFVAAQVYSEATDPDTELVEKYVRTFLAVYELSDLSDVNDLLGRQSFEEQNYSGQKALAEA